MPPAHTLTSLAFLDLLPPPLTISRTCPCLIVTDIVTVVLATQLLVNVMHHSHMPLMPCALVMERPDRLGKVEDCSLSCCCVSPILALDV